MKNSNDKKIETLPLSATAILTKLTDQWNDAIFKYNHNVKKSGNAGQIYLIHTRGV
jgi:hypothetical protein